MHLAVVGLALAAGPYAWAAHAPTFAKEVSRIVQKNCEGCHRPGQVGPFALTNYDQVRSFAAEIKRVTEARIMPPWSAVPGHGEFRNERRLSEQEIETLAKWVGAGTPLGNKKDLPAPVKYTDQCAPAKPHPVFPPDDPYELSRNALDEYLCF